VSAREPRGYRIEGRVQGVGFRAFVVRLAREHGVHGGVRNEADGSVWAVAEGDADSLARFRAGLERGPAHARVERVSERAATPAGERFDARF
jgi:acylphosphatase